MTTQRWLVPGMLLAGAGLLAVSHVMKDQLILEMAARVIVLALAAASLDLLVGYAGLVSFGHAMFLLTGGYTVGILAKEGIISGFVQWPAAIVVSGLAALLTGLLAVRTGGVYFIMLTLAFAQMAFYLVTGLSAYGGDEGLPLYPRSTLLPGIRLEDPVTMFVVVLLAAASSFYVLQRIVGSSFGMALSGCRQSEGRMRALGYNTYRLKLIAYVVAGAICGLAGALLANVTGFLSSEYGSWQRSGELLVMVILGGMGTLSGPLIGAIVLIAVEHALSERTEHWPLLLGALLLIVAIALPNGLRSILRWRSA